MRTIDEAKTYFSSLAKEAGLDEASTNAILNSLGNEKFQKGVLEHLVRQDEMSSYMDRTRNEAQAKIRETEERYQKWYNDVALPAVSEAEKLKPVVAKYKEVFGDIATPTGDVAPRNPDGTYASKKEMEAMAMSAVQIAKQMPYLQALHMKDFGEPFDPEDFEKFVVSRGLPPNKDALTAFAAPRYEQKRQQAEAERQSQHESAIKAARDEGYRAGLSAKRWDGETARTTDGFGRDVNAVKNYANDPDAQQRSADEAFLDVMSKEWNPEPAAAR